MATSKKKNKVLRTLITFIVMLVALFGLLGGSAVFSNGSWAPKLAIDLEGGTQLILSPVNIDKTKDINLTEEDLTQAINVIRQRVDASGVSEAEIQRQGINNIVVGLPGTPSEDTLNLVRSSAVMRFRTVLRSGNGLATATRLAEAQNQQINSASPTPSASQSTQTPENPEAKAEESASPTPTPAPSSSESPAPSASPTPVEVPPSYTFDELNAAAANISDTPKATPNGPLDQNWITERDEFLFANLDCSQPEALEGGSGDDPAKPLVTCSKDGQNKWILGPTVLEGTDVTSASAGMSTNQQGQSTGRWVVNLKLNGEGATKFDDIARILYPNHVPNGDAPDNNRFAIVLDSLVLSAPGINAQSYGGSAEISGSFTRNSATTLANQLQFGSLPLNFEVQSENRISATLGSEHLKVGIIAALIGLGLVVLYLLWQYHALSIVAASSLILAFVLTYLAIAILSWSMNYRLSLAGVMGLIVAVGTTMDSFVVYFERIRDEVRDGKPLVAAVDTGWARAKRTIVVSDLVNLVAAGVLYFLAVGNVQGFAFTLGLTTLMDLIIIFMFTHPCMSLLMKFKYFAYGKKFSGLDPQHLGATSRTYATPKEVIAKGVTQSLARMKAQKAQEEAKATKAVSELKEGGAL